VTAPNLNLAWCAAIADELAHCGVQDVLISPGSRSAPLAIAFAQNERLRCRSVLDERSAAFFALGLARAARRPVAVVCTSGTAAANYLPAVAEAYYSQIPLIVITADRPPEQRECGAGQTLVQTDMYEPYARFAAELPLPEATDRALLHARGTACRVVAAALGEPAGPAHLNVPLREPLDPGVVSADVTRLETLSSVAVTGRVQKPLVRVERRAAPAPSEQTLDRLAAWITAEPRGCIAVGPLELHGRDPDAFSTLALTAGWPLLADALSPARFGASQRLPVVQAHDAVLRTSEFVRVHAPRRVLRFGAMLTSKAFRTMLESDPSIEQCVIDPWEWRDPTGLAVELLRCDPLAVAAGLVARLPREHTFSWYWDKAGEAAQRAIDAQLDSSEEPSEPGIARAVVRALPARATLFVGNSMPVRDVDSFAAASPRPLRVVANRGANGIDGTLACALGTAVGSPGPFAALIGDLSLLHDMSSLLIARDPALCALIVIVDNDGGGIFEFLPVAQRADRELFETHFGTPQGTDIPALLASLGLPCTTVRTLHELQTRVVGESLATEGVRFIHVRTERRANRELHAKLFEAAAAAIAAVERSA